MVGRWVRKYKKDRYRADVNSLEPSVPFGQLSKEIVNSPKKMSILKNYWEKKTWSSPFLEI
jgi:hypothetical protein